MDPKPFSLPLIVPAAALLCALAWPAGAQAGSLVRNETVTEAKKHERQTRERECEVMQDDDARLRCQAEAKAERKQAEERANADFEESQAARKAEVADAHAAKRAAKADCRALQGDARDQCLRDAKQEERARVAAAHLGAGEKALDTQRALAMEHCEKLKGAAKTSCVEGVRARYGK